MYFFVVMDCDGETHKRDKHMPKIELELDITVNVEGQPSEHFSYEEYGMLTLHLILFLIFLLVFSVTIYSYIQYKNQF